MEILYFRAICRRYTKPTGDDIIYLKNFYDKVKYFRLSNNEVFSRQKNWYKSVKIDDILHYCSIFQSPLLTVIANRNFSPCAVGIGHLSLGREVKKKKITTR
jgi:hypothetical protein